LLDDNIGQTEKKKKATKRVGILRGGSYFTQTASTEFPVVGGQLPKRCICGDFIE
jgi:hypothetical protein